MLERVNATIQNRAFSSVILLICCLLFIFIVPAIEFRTNIISIVLFSAILFFAAYSINRKTLLVGIIAILIELATRSTDFKYLHYFAELATNLFIIFIVLSVIRHLMTHNNVTIYSLIDAVNGYLLLGIMFMSLVAFCDTYFPGAYNTPGESDMELVYYTMITLTTAGYGDITPKLPLTQSLSMFIAVIGQFYVAVIVAILVGKYAALSGTSKSA